MGSIFSGPAQDSEAPARSESQATLSASLSTHCEPIRSASSQPPPVTIRPTAPTLNQSLLPRPTSVARVPPTMVTAPVAKVGNRESFVVTNKDEEDEDCLQCRYCDRVFYYDDYKNDAITERACDQHERSKHPRVYQEYKEEEEFEEDNTDMEPPVPGLRGRWVPRERFLGNKSFGYFECACGRTWFSAHAWRRYAQGCKGCPRSSLPLSLWQNENTSPKEKQGKEIDLSKPHARELCQACIAFGGDCRIYLSQRVRDCL